MHLAVYVLVTAIILLAVILVFYPVEEHHDIR